MTKNTPPKSEKTVKENEPGHPAGPDRLTDGDLGGRDSVDRIRDIIFGAQARQYEQRFLLLEETFRKDVANLREATRKTIETLEIYTKKELESLVAQLKTEQAERADASNHLAANIDAAAKNLEKKITRLEESAHAGQRKLQEQILQQSKNLMDEIQRTQEESTAALKKTADELRKDKTDRTALGNLFNEVGLRLKDEFPIPDGK